MKKRILLAFALLTLLAPVCLGQTEAAKATPSPSASPKPKPAMSKAQIQKSLVASEKKLWEAWKNKDVKPFKAWILADGLQVSDEGIGTKADVVKSIGDNDCVVKSYSLSDFKLSLLNSSTALLTYKGSQDYTCGGTTGPANIWASSIWVQRGGKWLNWFHQETPAKQ